MSSLLYKVYKLTFESYNNENKTKYLVGKICML